MGPSLLVRALLQRLQEVAEKTGLEDFHVRHTINKDGALVVCVIAPAPKNDPHKWKAHG